MCQFSELVERIVEKIPEARFKLLGTAGMVPGAAEVLAHFPRRRHPRIEVVPRYEPDRLPMLLADCWVGVFPSLLEGFGYGVLEMMAAAVPVVAYDVTGPSEIVEPEQLVPIRDIGSMAERVVALLSDRDALAAARRSARVRSRDFVWEEIAAQMCADYARALADLRQGATSG
jgi:glycosyltransferase involved in cell wall biosynthesis